MNNLPLRSTVVPAGLGLLGADEAAGLGELGAGGAGNEKEETRRAGEGQCFAAGSNASKRSVIVEHRPEDTPDPQITQ
jgi:hypothetical protein